MNTRIGIIGHFGINFNLCDGHTVKTRNLAMLLESYGYAPAIKVDTYLFKLKKLTKTGKLIFDTLRCLCTCKHVFLLVSVNGMKFYLPFMYYLNRFTKCRIYHYVIGSELLDMIDEDTRLIKYLNALTVNWFEYESGTKRLRNRGVQNAATLENFKMITPVSKPVLYEDVIYRFCTFSRVMEEKGITDAISAICEINKELGYCGTTLDIYGPIDQTYEDTFRRLLEKHGDCITYRGVAESSSSVDILKEYYALLFPTHWVGEGVPGTIIDAFASGIPVIASDWKANSELIKNGQQGVVYPNSKMRNLKEAILWAVQNPKTMLEMRIMSRAEFNKFMPERIMSTILDEMLRR